MDSWEKMNNLILIGMPASGKSTVGIILAKVIGYDFIDSDLLIQRRERMRLPEIIQNKGVDGFIEVENEVNSSIEASRCVISTGGSAVYGEEAMQHFREIGAVIYLQVDFEVIRKRLHNIKRRGVVLRGEGSFSGTARPSGTCMMSAALCMKNTRTWSSGRQTERLKTSWRKSYAGSGKINPERISDLKDRGQEYGT